MNHWILYSVLSWACVAEAVVADAPQDPVAPSLGGVTGSWTFLYDVKVDAIDSSTLTRLADAIRAARPSVRKDLLQNLLKQEELCRQMAAQGGKSGHSQVIKYGQVYSNQDYYWRQDIDGGWDSGAPNGCTWQALVVGDAVIQRQTGRSTDSIFTVESRTEGGGFLVEDQILWDSWQEHWDLVQFCNRTPANAGVRIIEMNREGQALPVKVSIPPNVAKIVSRETTDGDARSIVISFVDAHGGVSAECLSQWIHGEPRVLRRKSFWLYSTILYYDIQIRVISREASRPLPTLLDVSMCPVPADEAKDLRHDMMQVFDPRDGLPVMGAGARDPKSTAEPAFVRPNDGAASRQPLTPVAPHVDDSSDWTLSLFWIVGISCALGVMLAWLFLWKRRFVVVRGACLLSLLLLASACGADAGRIEEPRDCLIWKNPEFSSKTYEILGVEEATLRRELFFINNSSRAIQILDVKTTCGCANLGHKQAEVAAFAVACLSMEISPSDVREFTVGIDWEAGGKRGVTRCRLSR